MEQTKTKGRDLFCSKIEKMKSGAIFLGAGAARRARHEEGASPPPKINLKFKKKKKEKAPFFNECLPNLPKVRKTKERCNKVNLGRSEAAVNAP